MKHFPGPIKPPASVNIARQQRRRDVVRSAGMGMVIRLIIIAFEFVGVYLFGSASLLLDALSSLFDVMTSMLFIVCIRIAAKPPDKNHPFGHGRIEPLIGLQMGLLLVVLGGALAYQQFVLSGEEPTEAISQYAWIFPLAALVLLEITYRIIMRSAKKHDSPALAADAMHYRIDSLTSLLAACALIIGVFYPEWSHRIDHIGAFVIAGIMAAIGFNAAWSNINQLLDKVPPDQYFTLVKEAAESVKGVLGTEKVRIQQYGPDAHVDIDIEVDPGLTVEVAHKISQQVRVEIQRGWPAVRDVTVHIEPYYPNDH